jgi:hypothetical protein
MYESNWLKVAFKSYLVLLPVILLFFSYLVEFKSNFNLYNEIEKLTFDYIYYENEVIDIDSEYDYLFESLDPYLVKTTDNEIEYFGIILYDPELSENSAYVPNFNQNYFNKEVSYMSKNYLIKDKSDFKIYISDNQSLRDYDTIILNGEPEGTKKYSLKTSTNETGISIFNKFRALDNLNIKLVLNSLILFILSFAFFFFSFLFQYKISIAIPTMYFFRQNGYKGVGSLLTYFSIISLTPTLLVTLLIMSIDFLFTYILMSVLIFVCISINYGGFKYVQNHI